MNKAIKLAVMLQVLCVSVYCTESSPLCSIDPQGPINIPLYGTKQSLRNLGDAIVGIESWYRLLSEQIGKFLPPDSRNLTEQNDTLFAGILKLCYDIQSKIESFLGKSGNFNLLIEKTVRKIGIFQGQDSTRNTIKFYGTTKMVALQADISSVHRSATDISIAYREIDAVLETLCAKLSNIDSKAENLTVLFKTVKTFLQNNKNLKTDSSISDLIEKIKQ